MKTGQAPQVIVSFPKREYNLLRSQSPFSRRPPCPALPLPSVVHQVPVLVGSSWASLCTPVAICLTMSLGFSLSIKC